MVDEQRTVLIAHGAERDLAAIYRRRLAQRGGVGPDGADALLDRLIGTIESLVTFALRCPVPPELDGLGIREYRQIPLAPFRIIYLPEAGKVTVIVVADARRDFRTLLEERLLRG